MAYNVTDDICRFARSHHDDAPWATSLESPVTSAKTGAEWLISVRYTPCRNAEPADRRLHSRGGRATAEAGRPHCRSRRHRLRRTDPPLLALAAEIGLAEVP